MYGFLTSSSDMAERARDVCNARVGDFKGVGHFEAINFRLKGYVSRQYLWTVRWGNGYSTTLPLDVFTERNFVADYSIEIEYYSERNK